MKRGLLVSLEISVKLVIIFVFFCLFLFRFRDPNCNVNVCDTVFDCNIMLIMYADDLLLSWATQIKIIIIIKKIYK